MKFNSTAVGPRLAPGVSSGNDLYAITGIAAHVATVNLALGDSQQINGTHTATVAVSDPVGYIGNPTFRLFILQDSVGGNQFTFGPNYMGVDPTQWDLTPGMMTILQITVTNTGKFMRTAPPVTIPS